MLLKLSLASWSLYLEFLSIWQSIQKLSFFGCNPNILNNEGNAPLHVMMQKARRECLMALLCHGADCNMKDAAGETVLHKAIKVSVAVLMCFIFYIFFVLWKKNQRELSREEELTKNIKTCSCFPL